MFTDCKVTENLCLADDFYKYYDNLMQKYMVDDASRPQKRAYHRDSMMSMAEVMTIIIPTSLAIMFQMAFSIKAINAKQIQVVSPIMLIQGHGNLRWVITKSVSTKP